MAQTVRPDATDSAGGWTDQAAGANLHLAVDETTKDDDTTYITADPTAGDVTCDISIAAPAGTPANGTGVAYMWAKRQTAGSIILTGTYFETVGASRGTIATSGQPASYTEFTGNLTGITAYTNTFIRLVAGSGGPVVRVTQLYVEYPDVASSGPLRRLPLLGVGCSWLPMFLGDAFKGVQWFNEADMDGFERDVATLGRPWDHWQSLVQRRLAAA